MTSFTNQLYSQAYLSFGFNGVTHEDTVAYGDSIFYSFWIINSGNLPLNDSIELTCETYNVSGLINMGSFGMFSTPSGNLNPGDSIFFNVYDIITPQSYSLGDNIVVIWPASIVPVSGDTSSTPLHVISNIMSNNNFYSSFELYPNPTTSNFYIKSNNKNITSFYIMDMYGRIVLSEENLNSLDYNIKINKLLSGLYFFILKSDEKEFLTKFIVK